MLIIYQDNTLTKKNMTALPTTEFEAGEAGPRILRAPPVQRTGVEIAGLCITSEPGEKAKVDALLFFFGTGVEIPAVAVPTLTAHVLYQLAGMACSSRCGTLYKYTNTHQLTRFFFVTLHFKCILWLWSCPCRRCHR